MAAHKIRLKARETIAEGTMAFHFERPQSFSFKAGQYIDLTLINPAETDWEGPRRSFSIASAPYEDGLTIATRMRATAFKRVLKPSPLGAEFEMQGPVGVFTLHPDPGRPAVFLAGGIGITPFLSIERQAAHEQLPHQLYLFYSNRTPRIAPFMELLGSAERDNPRFRFIPSMTEMDGSSAEWDGETERINSALLGRYIPPQAKPIYYVAGPPPMVVAMRKMLKAASVSRDDIRIEEFAGY